MPAFPDLLAMAAAFLGVATWIIPWARYAYESSKPPRTSLAAVGRVIGFFVLSGCFSAAALLLALLAFVFAENTGWAWIGLGAAIGYWPGLGLFIVLTPMPPPRHERDGS